MEGYGMVLRLKDLVKLLGVSRSSIYAWIKENRFPKPRKIGKRVSVWLEEDIREWLNKASR